MKIKEFMFLFRDWQDKQKDRGIFTSIELFSDGSGKILDADGNMIFEFDTIANLINFLEGV
jgi:hypothetical protein